MDAKKGHCYMRHLRNIVVFLSVMVSAYLFGIYFSVVNLLMLVPWDTTNVRPPVGTWQRSLNDFFEVPHGEYMVFAIVGLLVGGIILRTLWHRWESAMRIVVANLIALVGMPIVLIVVFGIQNLFFPIQYNNLTGELPTYGYGRSVVPMIAIAIIFWLWAREVNQLRYVRREKQKNEHIAKGKNRQAEAIASRLVLLDADYTVEDAHSPNSSCRVQRSKV